MQSRRSRKIVVLTAKSPPKGRFSHASHHFHPVLRNWLNLDSRCRLCGRQNIQRSKRQHSLPQVRGLPGLPLAPGDCVFKHATARRNDPAGWGAYAIRALPDL